MSKGKDLVKGLIESKKVFVVSKPSCPFCVKAKKVLNKYSIPKENIEILELENRSDMDEIQDYMKTLTGGRSVPRVFIGGKCIGGGDETQALDRQGKLKPMLESAGAL